MHLSDSSDEDLEKVDVLASDFLARYRNGDRPTVEEYAGRHPELSDSIRHMFPLVASIERIKVGEQVEADGSASLAGRFPEKLGDFQIVREIGRGGMGIVFEAYQESLDRSVAIKVLPRQSLLDKEAFERFRTEATTAASMHHTHIVPIFGTGESDGSHYLVMQLIHGESLDCWIEQGKQAAYSEVARIGEQVADAIAYSHANSVLHRDIKPANILIEDGVAKVTDFGLAKSLGAELTNTSQIGGSLRYMAPERFSGVSDKQGDVYGIGLTLYELLIGGPAFEEKDPEQLIGAITSSRLRSMRAIRQDIPIDLATIVAKAVDADPKRRYQNALELRDDLRRFLGGEPIHARRLSKMQKLAMWSRRNKKLSFAIAVASLALLGASFVSTIAYLQVSVANTRSTNALQTSQQTVDLALQSLDGVMDVISGLPTSSNLDLGDSLEDLALPNVDLEPSPISAEILERLQPIYARLSNQSPTRPDIVLQMVDASIQLARIQHSLARTADGMDTLRSSIRLLRERKQAADISEDALQLRLARLNNELGNLYAAEFQRDECMDCFRAAVLAASKVRGSLPEGQIELARAHLNVGNLPPQLRRQGAASNEEKAEELAQVDRAIEILEELTARTQESKTISILLARGLLARSRLVNAPHRRRSEFSKSVELLRRQLERSPSDANVHFELVQTLSDANIRGQRSPRRLSEIGLQLDESLRELEDLRTRHPENAVFLATGVHLRHKRSAIARTQGDYESAERLLGEAVELQGSLVKQWPTKVQHRCWLAMLYRSQAMMYRELGRTDETNETIAAARKLLAEVSAEFTDHPFFMRTKDAIRALEN